MKIKEALVIPMMHDAASQYSAHVEINQSNRTAEQAQQFHVCHMFLYNYYKHLLPKYRDRRTISWAHISDPVVRWALIDEGKSAFLRTKNGGPARLKAGLPKWEEAPDEAASRKEMAGFLEKCSVRGMAAPGVDGCGEPCCCGGHASKHITGQACDLQGLQQLGEVIMKAEPGKYRDSTEAVDIFLHKHHLYRPMGQLKGKQQELWHVEAIPVHIRHFPHGHHHAHHRRVRKAHHGC